MGARGAWQGPPLFLSRHEHQQSHGNPPGPPSPKPTQCHWGSPRPPLYLGRGLKVCSFCPPSFVLSLGWDLGKGDLGGFSLQGCNLAIFLSTQSPAGLGGLEGGPCCRFGF